MRIWIPILFVSCSIWGVSSDKPQVSSPLASRVVVAGTAAAVGTELFTVSDAYLFRCVRSLLDEDKLVFTPLEMEDLKRIVNRMLFELMVFGEMKNLRIALDLKSQADRRWNEIKKRHPQWKKVLSTYSKPESAVVEAIWRRLEIEKFVEKKVETFTPIITDSEIEKYYEQSVKQKTEALDPQRAGIRSLLQKKHVEKSLGEWIRFLQEKYSVVNLLGTTG